MSIAPKQFAILLKDNNGNFLSYLENKIDIASLSWEWTRIGGCGGCNFTLHEKWNTSIVGSLAEDYEINIFAPLIPGGTAELMYSGYIDRVTPTLSGKDESVSVSCLGYANKLKKVIVKDREFIGAEISSIVDNILNTYVSPITDIKNSIPDDENTVLLLHCEDLYKDEKGHTITKTGDIQISNTVKKLGAGALHLNGTGYITITQDSDFDFGAGDFTIEFYAYWSSYSTMNFINRNQDLGTWFLFYFANGTWTLWCRKDYVSMGDYTFVWGLPVYQLNTWYHIAIERHGTTARLFIDGIEKTMSATTEFGTNDIGIVDANITIPNPNLVGDGYMDEIRISKGVARYLSNFTPPQFPFANLHDKTDFSADKLYFNETAYDVISKLADIAGKIEWGVDADKQFYFKKRNDRITRWINLTEKGVQCSLEKDFNPIITKIYLLGGDGYEGIFSITNKKSIKEEIVSNSAIVTQSVAQQFARMYLKEKGVPVRSYNINLINYNQRLESTIPLGKVAIFEKIGIQSKYDTGLTYDTGLKYDGGTENYQIERIKYTLSNDGINVSLTLGHTLPSIVDDLAKLEYLISSERSR